jgi:hypothetical protein
MIDPNRQSQPPPLGLQKRPALTIGRAGKAIHLIDEMRTLAERQPAEPEYSSPLSGIQCASNTRFEILRSDGFAGRIEPNDKLDRR